MSFQPLENLEGRVVVITGGAGQIGVAAAKALAALGARVVALVRRDLPQAQSRMEELPQAERLGHFAVLAKITESESLRIAAEEVIARAGRCDILINAAAVNRAISPVDLEALTDEIFDEIVTTNLRGTFAAIRAFAPALKASGDGLIVNMSSVSSFRANNRNVAYGAAKAGVNFMTLTLAKALAPKVRVVAIASSTLPNSTSGIDMPSDRKSLEAALVPLGRLSQPEDIASAIVAFATTLRFANGTILTIDGGRSA
jgi:3-oxoacyl-[acyl-carrier protein] reductase